MPVHVVGYRAGTAYQVWVTSETEEIHLALTLQSGFTEDFQTHRAKEKGFECDSELFG